MWQIGIFLFKLIHLFGKLQNAFIAVCGLQGGELHAAQEELLYFLGVVFRHSFGNQFLYCLFHILILDRGVVLIQGLQIFAFLILLKIFVWFHN